ncbi:hypothetical protein RJT34_22101 [Clitoria ternatea]|uniref:Membrane protein of ER body-like protein n=1 Tax=Clitoria ternatea TaxID=43366 RepID=A0AAN9IUX6_CLITE
MVDVQPLIWNTTEQVNKEVIIPRAESKGKTVTKEWTENDGYQHEDNEEKSTPTAVHETSKTTWNVGKSSYEGEEKEKEEKSGPVSVYWDPSDSLIRAGDGAAIGLSISTTNEVREIFLRKMFVMPPNHEFYCPKCNVCIDKVLFCTQGRLDPPSHPEPPVRCSACFTLLIEKGKEFFSGLLSRVPPEPVPNVPRSDPTTGQGDIAITVGPTPPVPPTGPQSGGRELEILKSIVYGGLPEILASLSVVTSAASAGSTTVNIVALAIANLIGGLSILGHSLRDLKASQPVEEGTSDTNAQVDKYEELLGKRDNFLLHAFFATLSFLVFGLVPPIVYGFSFRVSEDKDFKLAALAGASLICIAVLAIAKAYSQRSKTYMTYIKTVSFYVTSGVLASLLTYVAGTLINRLLEHLGWFEPTSNFGFSEMSIQKPGWGSY